MFLRVILVQIPTCSPNFKASRSVSMLKTHSTKNFFNQVSRKAPLRTSPKLSRCRHGRRRAPVSLLVLLCKTSVSDFGTEAKITNQSFKAGHGSSPAALSCKNILVRSTQVECSCVWFLSKNTKAGQIIWTDGNDPEYIRELVQS